VLQAEKTQEESPMEEGVLVSAQKADSTITITVVSDELRTLPIPWGEAGAWSLHAPYSGNWI